MIILDVKNIHTYYGDMHALEGILINVGQSEIVTLIGANGAGKTTTLNSISGVLKPRSGSILFKGEEIQGLAPHQIVGRGMGVVPEGHQVFPRLMVVENLEMGAYSRNDKKAIAEEMERVFTIFPRLKERAKQLAGTLSGGEQQMLSIGRALMAKPELLILDEPSLGLSPLIVEEIFEVIRRLKQEGMTILLVEQNAVMAFSLAERGYVLETGRVVLEGPVEVLKENPQVKAAYLGGG